MTGRRQAASHLIIQYLPEQPFVTMITINSGYITEEYLYNTENQLLKKLKSFCKNPAMLRRKKIQVKQLTMRLTPMIPKAGAPSTEVWAGGGSTVG